jgi:3-(3-hydroxy-phenyl)propionate hydroxylase
MQAVGIIRDLLPQIVLGYGSDYISPGGSRFLRVKPMTLEYGHPRRNAFRQTVLEELLRERFVGRDHATLRFETEFVDFSQSDAAVTVRLSHAGKTQQLTCDYLLACDGARSGIRQSLDIAMHGSTFRERWLIVDLEQTTDPYRDTRVYCNPARPCLSLPGPNGTRRFEFMLHDGENDEDVLKPENVAALLRRHGRDDTAILKRKVVYTFHARMADKWRAGRIFLAGDAAHLMPPFAGQGMNSGVRDAQNIAWKIAAVVTNSLGPGLLDTYELERRSHAAQMIELAIRMGRVMMPASRIRAFLVQSLFRVLALYPTARSYFAEMKYKPKPRFETGFLRPAAKPVRTSLIGRLFPQPIVADAEGYALLDDKLGTGFVLLAPPGTDPGLLERLPPAGALPMPVRLVAVIGKDDASRPQPPVVAVRDLRGELATLLAAHPPGLFLLRPDRYVAAFFDLSEISTTWDEIRRLFETTTMQTAVQPRRTLPA